jgi:hypothetical protein
VPRWPYRSTWASALLIPALGRLATIEVAPADADSLLILHFLTSWAQIHRYSVSS